ncbi:uncharacterized protein LOC112154045 [Oryzias melastigma]|uniref:Uncharacterized LOC112154045 n=1 Tax=Oryzias melastigma TaxID=30732 RepID=A0A3B3BQ52_ORYME|nr:uncharacterized protein LOC112154045 [Oryzias melastigma]
MASQIAKVTKGLTTAADMRKTTQMLMQPNANWEEYLAPAPLSIAIMGELVFISSSTDFSINKNPPKDGFKYIKYPDSFRACLMQICNSGWQAFNIAHKNMDQIRIHTASVPDYMKAAVKFLFQGDDEIVEKFLPNQLESIRTIAEDCVKLADGVEQKYQDVISLIQELLEACINAKHIYGEDLEKVQNKIKENKLREKTAKELEEKYDKAMKAMEKQVEEAQEQFKTSMNSLPTGAELIVMEIAGAFSQTVTAMGSAVAAMASRQPQTQPQQCTQTGSSEQVAQKNETEKEDPAAEMEIYAKSPEILTSVGSFLEYIDKDEIIWKTLYDQQKKEPKTKFFKGILERISKEMEKAEKSKAKDSALSLCKRGIAIFEQIATYSPDKKWDKTKTKKLIEEVRKLQQDTQQFDSKSKMKNGVSAITAQPPMMSKMNPGQNAGQMAVQNARFQIEQSKEQLKQCREEYNKAVGRMERNKKELTDILVEMQNCDVKKIEFDTTIKMLVKGMDAMGRVKEQWEKMVRFFQMVANIVKTSLSKTMNHFAQSAKDAQTLSYNSRLFTKDLLYNQAFQASNIASLVHMISGTYCEVSNKHLMDRISSLGRLMTLENTNPEFDKERKKLQESCQDAQESILKLVIQNKKDFEKNTDTRMAQIEGGLKAVLPAADPEETKRIQEIVQGGMTEEETDCYI